MTNSETPSSKNIWKSALDITMAHKGPIGLIAVAGIFIPQLVLTYILDQDSIAVVQSLKSLSKNADASAISMFEFLLNHFSNYFTANLFVWGLFVTSYFAILEIIVSANRNQPINLSKALLGGVKSIFPKGFSLSLAIMVLLILGQSSIFTFPALILATLGLTAPVIMVSSPKGALSSIWEAISLKYVRGTAFNTWSVMFGTMSIGAIFYATFSLSHLFLDFILYLDDYIAMPRDLWVNENILSPVYLAGIFFSNILSTIAAVLLPGVTTAMYFTVLKSKQYMAA